ncbi:hypothetical protein [Streptomyces ginkgonis]|uniref:hypothetical protein n=1 Tax=Streptomyces ginkgonis TaxID=1812259 RepID=UPI002176E858|nr:hypothetical protein [Streptomyces ginkgonis]
MGAGAEPVAASRTVVQLRPVASALPMGFLGLAGGTFVLAGAEGWKHTAGVIGLVLAAVAVYAAFALAVEDQHRRTVLPTGRRAAGAGVLDGDWGHQTDRIVREAGVRRQL